MFVRIVLSNNSERCPFVRVKDESFKDESDMEKKKLQILCASTIPTPIFILVHKEMQFASNKKKTQTKFPAT